VHPIGTAAPAVTARLRDPAGNVIGLYLDPHLFDIIAEVKTLARAVARDAAPTAGRTQRDQSHSHKNRHSPTPSLAVHDH
jgi:hypothetical protein